MHGLASPERHHTRSGRNCSALQAEKRFREPQEASVRRTERSFSSLYCLKKQLVIARAAGALPFVGCDKRKQKHARIRKSESAIRAITLPSALLRFYFSSTSIKPLRRRVSPRLLYSRSGVSQLNLLEGLIKPPARLYFSYRLLTCLMISSAVYAPYIPTFADR